MPGGVLENDPVLPPDLPYSLGGQNPVMGTNPDLDIPYAQADVRQDPWDNRTPFASTPTYYKLVLPRNPYFKSVEELYQDSEGTPFDANGVRTYSRRFLVTAWTNLVGPMQVAKCPGIPVPYAPYIPYRVAEFDLSARCVRITARRRVADDHQQWVVQCDYSTQLPPGGHPDKLTDVGWPDSPVGFMNNPWDEPPHIEIDPETSVRIPDLDRTGKPYLNSVQQPFATPVSVDDATACMVVTRNYRHPGTLQAVLDHVEQYSLAVNSDIFVNRPIGTVRLDPVKMTEMYRGRTRYWRAVYRFRFKKRVTLGGDAQPGAGNIDKWDTWQPRVLDNGMFRWRRLLGAPVKTLPPVPIMRSGHPVSFPVPLDGAGAEAPRDANGKVTPYWHQFTEHQTVPFSGLVLPAYKL